MGTPYTQGKTGSNRAGGHTAGGVGLPANAKPGATSKVNNRHANLKTRTHGK